MIYLGRKYCSLLLAIICGYCSFAKPANPGGTVTGTSGCGCDFTITPNPADNQAVVDGTALGVKPGNKVCIASGHYTSINLSNFVGTKSQPVTIINCGGLVNVSGYPAYGFILHSSRYVRISGSGDAGFKYGILIDGSVARTAYGFGEDNHASDVEIDHFEVSKISGVGMGCAPTPSCDPTTWSTSWKMYNMSFHDNYVHETTGEGFYIGNTQPYYIYNCGSLGTVTVQPQQIDSLKFYNNVIDKAGWTGAQISLVSGGVDIHDNLITNFGNLNMPQHQSGLIVGGISRGKVYNNKIINGSGNAFECFGAGVTTFYNNVLVGAGYDGSTQGQSAIFVDDRPKPPGFPGLRMYIFNNTIVSPKRNGISFYNDYGTVDTGSIIANNIIAGPGLYASYPTFAFIDLQANPHASLYNNLSAPAVAQAAFVNGSGNDFHLLVTSPAVGAGVNAGPYGITYDYDYKTRPVASKYDIGAFEYSGTKVPPLIANAGDNQTIKLPVNSATLNGSKSADSGGTITAFSWSVVSGPSGAVISNKLSISTSVTDLVEGTYVFKLTLTDSRGLTASNSVSIQVLPPNNSLPSNPMIQVRLYGGINPFVNTAWNNWNVADGTVSTVTSAPLSYVDGSVSPVTATLSSEQGVGDNGANYSGNIAPPAVLRYASYSSTSRTLTINNIPATAVSSLELYASRITVGNSTIFSVNGVQDTVVTAFNMKKSAFFSNVRVTNGQIIIRVDKIGNFNYINGFRLYVGANTGKLASSTTVSEATDITKETNPTEKLSVYPNPVTSNQVNLIWSSSYTGQGKITIYDASGKMILTKNLSKVQQEYRDQIVIGLLPSGLYFLTLTTQNGKSITQKIIKE